MNLSIAITPTNARQVSMYDKSTVQAMVRAFLAGAASLVAVASATAQVVAAPAASVSRTVMERFDVPGTDLETRLYLIVYPPGMAAPVHHHPVDGIGYVLEGTARTAYGKDAPTELVAGQSFHELPIVPHTLFENSDPKRELKFLIAVTAKKGTPLIEVP